MKRSFDNTAKTEQDDSKRLKTNNEASPSQTGDGSSSSRAVVFRSDFSSDVFTPNQNVWSTSCDNQNPRHATWNRFVPIRPETFFDLQKRLFTPSSNLPIDFPTDPRLQELSKDIWYHFLNCQQPDGMYRQKIELWVELNKVLVPDLACSTHAFGSTLNGFGSHESDLDLCLFFASKSASSMLPLNKSKGKDDVEFLKRVQKKLRQHCRRFLSPDMELIPAKVPILKIYDNFGRLEVDLSCNNPLSINNTHLLYCYSQTLSSYTLTLMVIHFLQAGVNPPVIPSLQDKFPGIFGSFSAFSQTSFFQELPQDIRSRNTMSLGELLTSFFKYYTDDFDFTRDAGSIRTGKVLYVGDCEAYARENQISPRQWEAYICMEEPFERTNAGRAIINREKFDMILREFKVAADKMRKGSKLQKLFSS